jgi:integrase
MKAAPEKKKYKPQILSTYKHRGFLVREIFNKKTKRPEFKARFQINNKEFNLTHDTRKDLEKTLDEIYYQERRVKADLPVPVSSPTVKELFAEHLDRLKKEGNRKKISIFERVSAKLLALVPAGIKINQIKKAHFQKYIDLRSSEQNKQSGRNILPETINKELSAASVAFTRAMLYFSELADAPPVSIPKAEAKKRRRERLVEKKAELYILLEYLRRPHKNKTVEQFRRLLADDLEIRYETGLRRKEVVRLKKTQYRPLEAALRDVVRWKTGTVTKFFPLTTRAASIIEARLDTPGEYLFSRSGKTNESVYRTLREACVSLGINYGTHKAGGWVPHDLRHNFASEIIQVTDIETAKSLTGHTGTHILTYLHTDEKRQRAAMNRREGKDVEKILIALYNDVKNGSMDVSAFVEKVGFLIKNG